MSFNINSTIQSHTTVLTRQSNYATWSQQVRSLLTMAGWWTIIDETFTYAAQAARATWISQDQQAQAMIAIFIHADMQHLQKDQYIATGVAPNVITHPSMFHNLWMCLQQLYAPTGVCYGSIRLTSS